MRIWTYIAAMMLILVYLLLIAIFAPPASPAVPLQYGEWCYWEKGLAKKRLRDADLSVQLVPLGK